MSLIRPELKRTLSRWREVLTGVAVAVVGGWAATFGGWFYQGLGAVIVALGLALAYVGWRRLRFHREGDAAGVVEVTEGQITYLAPAGGGFAARTELTEISLGFDVAGRAHWRIAQTGAPPLSIPVSAAGADALFDAFVALPGANPARILAALDRRPADGPVTVWRRNPRLALT